MLVLGVKKMDRIRMTAPDGTNVWITFCKESQGGMNARIGIEAPRDWPIVREAVIKEGDDADTAS